MTGQAIETLLAPHMRIRLCAENNTLWCNCGKTIWTLRHGFAGGNLTMFGGEQVQEAAHRAHLADVIRTTTLAALADAEHLTDREKTLFAETLREVWG